MALVHLADPLKGGAPGERGAVLREPRGKRAGPWIRELWRLDERIEERGGGQVSDAEAVADEVAARLELALEAVDRRERPLARDLGAGGVDLVAEPVERTEDGREDAQRPPAAATHADGEECRGEARIMDELGVHEHRPDRRPELLVEEVLERERAATPGLVPRVEGRLRKCALEGLDDARRVVDRTTVEGEHRDGRLPRHSQDLGEVKPGQERPAHVRDPLEVERPAGLLVEVRDGEVPEHRKRHRRYSRPCGDGTRQVTRPPPVLGFHGISSFRLSGRAPCGARSAPSPARTPALPYVQSGSSV